MRHAPPSRAPLFLLLIACALSPRLSPAAIVYGPIYDPFSNSNLYITSRASWLGGEADAQSIGGHLATVHSAAENQFMVDHVMLDFSALGGPNLSSVPAWIGYFDAIGAAHDDGPGGPSSQHAANFRWADGSTSSYTSWNSGSAEPNDSTPGEYYAEINWHWAAGIGPKGTWNDDPVSGSIPALNPYNPNSYGPSFGIAAVPLPEPSSIALAIFGAVGLIALILRRR